MAAVTIAGKTVRFEDGLPYARLTLKGLSALLIAGALFQILSFPFKLSVKDSSSAVSLQAQVNLQRSNQVLDYASHAIFYVPKGEFVATGPGLDEILKAFHLVGIIQGEKPEALIKNDMNQQTYFARAGEKFDRFQVTEILGESIKVEFENQTKEMFLEEGIS